MSDEVAGSRHQVHHPIDDHHKHARQNERDGNFRRHHCQVVRAQTVKSGRSFARENPSVISHCTSHHHHHHHHCSIQPLTFNLSLYCVGHIIHLQRHAATLTTRYHGHLHAADSLEFMKHNFTDGCVLSTEGRNHRALHLTTRQYDTLYQGRINHSGAPYQRKAGALFSYAKPGFSYLWPCTFSQKLTTFFSLRYV